MTTWLTSDQHYGHHNIIKYCGRPFDNVDHMTYELIARHNARVQDDDTVWHLGDFSMQERLVPEILHQLKGQHILVMGNHDKCYPKHKHSDDIKQRYLGYGFKEIHLETRLDDFLVNHLPYIGDGGKLERYPQYRPKDDGGWLLHGHIHEKWKINDRMINVGVDVWNYAPVELGAIKKIVLALKIERETKKSMSEPGYVSVADSPVYLHEDKD